MLTFGKPRTIEPPCAVMSPMRAAGLPPIMTFGEPMTIVSGGPTQVHMSPMRAAGMPPIRTVGWPGGRIGPPDVRDHARDHRTDVHVAYACCWWHLSPMMPVVRGLFQGPFGRPFGLPRFLPTDRSI